MDSFNGFIAARVVHILAVVLWIGGVAFVTTVLLPALKRYPQKHERMQVFEQLEGRFSLQAKFTTLATLLSGIYMIEYLDAWGRFAQPQFWWMHAMVLVWLIFSLVLFVFEPLFLHEYFRIQAEKNPEKTLARAQRMHTILLTISLITLAGSLAGAHGFVY